MTNSSYHSGTKRRHCFFCGAYGNLEEHHVIPQRFGGPDEQENIVELCKSCHKKIESLYDKSFYEWFGIEDETGRRQFHRTCTFRDCDKKAQLKLQLVNLDSKFSAKKLSCLDHAMDEVVSNRECYWLASEQVDEFHFNAAGLDRLGQTRRNVLFRDEGPPMIPLNRDDILKAKVENVTPRDESGGEVSDIDLLREFVLECSEDVEPHLYP